MRSSTSIVARSVPSRSSVAFQGALPGNQRLAMGLAPRLVPQKAVAPSGRCSARARAMPMRKPFSFVTCTGGSVDTTHADRPGPMSARAHRSTPQACAP